MVQAGGDYRQPICFHKAFIIETSYAIMIWGRRFTTEIRLRSSLEQGSGSGRGGMGGRVFEFVELTHGTLYTICNPATDINGE